MKLGKLRFLVLLACSLVFCSGCEIFREALEESYSSEDPTSDDFESKFNIGVFQIVQYPRASILEKEISIDENNSICINTNALFSSKRIRQARAIPRPGNPDVYDLEFRIDRMGKTQWMVMHGSARNDRVVMMVDDRFVGFFRPQEFVDGKQDWVKVRIGVDNYTAKGIVKFAKKNYEYYNPEAKSWFNNLF
ncbi:MAG: hypothetical protein E7058_03640 [Lentisphaerae bacterium]|nr:hypothetical protein [Lentisphaerota bacterium]